MNVSREAQQQAAVSALLVDCKKALQLLHLSHQDNLCADLMKHMEAVERAFKEPSNVIRIGDHMPERANYAAVQDAVADAMEERS